MSANRMAWADGGISSPLFPRGYPWPFTHSWWSSTICATSYRPGTVASVWAPTSGCARTSGWFAWSSRLQQGDGPPSGDGMPMLWTRAA